MLFPELYAKDYHSNAIAITMPSKSTGLNNWPFPAEPYPAWGRLRSSIIIPTVGAMSKVWMCYLNRTKFHNVEVLRDAVSNRPKGRALLTVCNHASCMDDPLMSCMLKWRQLVQPFLQRWTPGAKEICFSNPLFSVFFALGQTIPIVRGDGVFQQGLSYSIDKMNAGKWVQIFPEGKIMEDRSWIRFKWGIGRMLYECNHNPIIVPVYHVGMNNVLPTVKPYIPRIGQKVTMVVGDPIDIADEKQKCLDEGLDPEEAREFLTSVIQERFEAVKKEALYKYDNEDWK